MSFFPPEELPRTISELINKNPHEVVPTSLMPSRQLMIREVGVHERHYRVLSLLPEGHRHCRFMTESARRHPSVLNSARPLELRESAVMGRTFEGPIEQPIYLRIQQELFGRIPGIAGDFWIQPRIEYFVRSRRDSSLKLEFKRLRRFRHYFISFFFLSLKYRSNWSRCSFQNRSYSCTHPATSRRGSPRSDM